jgi:hypothetical protein
MKGRDAVWWLLASGVLAWTSLGISGAAATGRDTTAPTDPHLDMVAALQATGPHSSLGDEAKVFGRFVGTWDGEYTEFATDGTAAHSSGEWTFGWVMGGRAIQDLFVIHPSAAHKDGFIGTTLRYFDAKSGTWSATFIDPESNSVATLTGGAVGEDRIDLYRQSTDGKETRWSFVDIRPESWVFRDEESRDGGKTWRLREEDHMKRRGAVPGARCSVLRSGRALSSCPLFPIAFHGSSERGLDREACDVQLRLGFGHGRPPAPRYRHWLFDAANRQPGAVSALGPSGHCARTEIPWTPDSAQQRSLGPEVQC